MFLNQAFCFVSVYLYNKYSGADNEKNVIVVNLWLIIISLFSLSMLCFATFMKLIKKEYRHTFYSSISGKDFLCQTWRNAQADKEKMYVFSKHRSYYKSINKELKQWLTQNWDNLEDEDWFTAREIKKIPSDLLPTAVLSKLGGEKGRKKSIALMIEAEEKKEKATKKEVKVKRGQILPLVEGGG